MSFVLTGCGRSGSVWLADILSRSTRVIVRHEHWTDGQIGPDVRSEYNWQAHMLRARKRFSCMPDNYGEVNSFLREVAMDLPVDKVGVLLRNPYDILLSSINKNPRKWVGGNFGHSLVSLERALESCHGMIEVGCPVFRMEDFTSRPEGLQQVLDFCEIQDVSVVGVPFVKKQNSSGRRALPSLDLLTASNNRAIKDRIGWFWDLFYKEEETKDDGEDISDSVRMSEGGDDISGSGGEADPECP